MAKRQTDFPVAAELAERYSKPFTAQFAAPESKDLLPTQIRLDELAVAVKLGGWRLEERLNDLEDRAKYGMPGERREAVLQLKAVGLIKSGKFSKGFVADHPVLLVDEDNDVFAPRERGSRLTGELLNDVKAFTDVPAQVPLFKSGRTPEEAATAELQEKTERFKSFVSQNPDWRREELQKQRQKEGMPQ